MTRVLRTALVSACALIACATLAPRPARAGSYVVDACSPATSAGPWAQVNTGPAVFASGNQCGGPQIGPLDAGRQGSLYAEDILSSAAGTPNGSRAGWTFSAPAGSLITAISYYRTLASHNDRDMAAGLFQADGSVLEQCRIALPFGSPSVCSMPNNQVPFVFSNLATPSLFFGVICDIIRDPALTECGGGGTIHKVQAYMYSSAVTLTENTAPTVTNVAGPLWGTGLVSGTIAVTFSASDNTGIREQAVQDSSGKTIVAESHGCDSTLIVPCPQQPSATLDVDTTRVADGTRTFQLVVTDGAGNSQVLTSPPVVVDNYGPPPPAGLSATVRPGSGTVALAWTNPASPPAPIDGAMAQLCSTSCTTAVRVNAFATAQLTAPGPGVYSARVWLLDTAGRGGTHNAASAVLTVPSWSAPPPPPGGKTRISAVLRGRRLHVSGPTTANRRITVSWRSKIRGRTVGHGSRTVTPRKHRLSVTFAIPRRARTHAATIRVAIRDSRRIVAHARARRA
jgi:hypothetical protein